MLGPAKPRRLDQPIAVSLEELVPLSNVYRHLRELFFDATKVHANAALDSLVPRFSHDATSQVSGLFADDLVAEDEHKGAGADPPPLGDVIGSPEGAAPEPAPRWKRREERRLDPDRPAVGSYRRTTDFRVSVTNPDATPMRTGSSTSLGYHDH